MAGINATDASGLNLQQRRFADAYIACGNATKAAIAAKYSPKNASQQGAALVDNPLVRNYIAKAFEQEHADAILTRAHALRLLTDIATGKAEEEVFVNVWDNESKAVITKKKTKTACFKDRTAALEVMLKFAEFEEKNEAMADAGKSADEIIMKALKERKVKGLPVEKDEPIEDEQAQAPQTDAPHEGTADGRNQ